MNHRLIVAPLLLLVPLSLLGRVPEASAEPVPCTTYSIVGSLNDEREATAYLHFDDVPLVGHEVFAVFSGGEAAMPPSILITDPAGTATVALPAGTNAVSFSAESPLGGACADADSSAGPAVVVVSDTVWQPGAEPALDLAVADPRGPAAEVVTSGTGRLAVTGPISPALPFAGALVLAAGWFARRLRGSDPGRSRPRACRFARIPL